MAVEQVERFVPVEPLLAVRESIDRFNERLEPAGTIMYEDMPRK